MSGTDGRPPAPRRGQVATLDAVRVASGGGFDVDAWHVMDSRDNALIQDELLNGSGSSKFVYSFPIAGSGDVSGISVIGARHLAAHYGGLKHRIIASVQKVGALHTFTSYPQPDQPMNVQCAVIHELADQEDYYEAIVEISDLKSGNSVQVQKRENRFEVKRSGERFERLHYSIIAQSKCYRNGILAVIPQDVQIRWKAQQLALQKGEVITADVMAEKRAAVLRFAASKGLPVDRGALEDLTMSQIGGLSDAARAGQASFEAAARALAVFAGQEAGIVQLVAEPAANAERFREPAPAQRSPESPPKAAAPAANAERFREPAPPEQQRASIPTWSGYLVTPDGEPVGEEHRDPAAFALAFMEHWRKSPDRPALLAANADTVDEARQASVDAAETLRDLEAPPESTHQPGSLEVAIPSNARGAAWPAYLKALRASLGQVAAPRLAAWAADNAPGIRSAPDSWRLQAVKLVQEHAAAVGAPVPDAITAAVTRPQPAAEKAKAPAAQQQPAPAIIPFTDQQWAEHASEAVNNSESRDELLGLVNGEVFARRLADLHTDAPALFKQVDDAIAQRLATLDAAPSRDLLSG